MYYIKLTALGKMQLVFIDDKGTEVVYPYTCETVAEILKLCKEINGGGEPMLQLAIRVP